MKKFFILILLMFLIALQWPHGKNLYGQAINFEWARQLGGTSPDHGNDIAVDDLGNVYTTGSFWGTADFDPGPDVFNLTPAGNNDAFISKLDNSGNFIWAKHFGGTSWDESYSIAIDTSGNIYTTGYFRNTVDFDPGPDTFNLTSAGGYDIFITKFDNLGNFIWAKRIGGVSPDDYGSSIAVDDYGNVYTTGTFWGTVDFDPGDETFFLSAGGGRGVFICKLDTFGDFVWAKHLGGIGWDAGFSITVDAIGNVFTTGTFTATADFDPGIDTFNLTSAGQQDIFISKLDPTGNFIWAKQFEGDSADYSFSIALSPAGNVYTTGYFTKTIDFDPGPDTFNLVSFGHKDVFISKLDDSGNFLWAKQIGGTSSEYGRSIAVDVSGNAYCIGYFWDTADFDPGPETFNFTSAGYSDVFIVNLDAAGNFIWSKQLGGVSTDLGFSIALDPSENLYATGSFNGTVDFDLGPGIFNLTSEGESLDIFVHKMSPANVGVEQIASGSQVKIYPNPTQGNLIIDLGREYSEVTIKLLNSFGKVIAEDNFSHITNIHYIIDKATGLYFVQIITGNGLRTVMKVLKK